MTEPAPRPAAEVPTPLGVVTIRAETSADEAFGRALFARSGPLAALPPEIRQRLADMQFDAQSAGYAAAFPDASRDIMELGGALVGRLTLDRQAASLRIVDVVIAPEIRGRGVGGAILRAVLERAGDSGLPVSLTVAAGNGAAIRLYERLGFRMMSRDDAHLALEWRRNPPSAP